MLAARAGGLKQTVEEAEAAAAAAKLQPDSLLERVRAFFGLEQRGNGPLLDQSAIGRR